MKVTFTEEQLRDLYNARLYWDGLGRLTPSAARGLMLIRMLGDAS